MRRTSLFLDDKLLSALKRAAKRDGVSVAFIIREAVASYLARPTSAIPLPSIAGRFASAKGDTADRVDEYLWRDPHG